MDSIVSEKGQVTIPKELRDQLGIRHGTVLEFSATGGKLIAAKQVAADPFEKWSGRGKFPKGIRTVDEYLNIVRNGDSPR
ncbi:MAG: transcriptional regulator, AbrB family [Verrucomicrobiales bacterium]|nr:transcriptional regulator, AbrB family [Verrucomicrobiales bacterium]